VTKLADWALLCSNCHRLIHRTERWLTVEDLKDLVAAQRTVPADALVPGRVD
jgi:5-methylcytosine-specific restriction enzyme A